MPAQSWEDLDDFLVLDASGGFALTAVIAMASTGGNRQVSGIFNDPTEDAHTGDFEATFLGPHLLCKATDLAGVQRYDTVTVGATLVNNVVTGGTLYDLTDNPALDGTGMGVLKLALPPPTLGGPTPPL
jgi:hypothetical protein